MRVTQSLEQTQFIAALDTLESGISTTQNQVSSGLSFTTPSENPAAAGTVNGLDQVLSQSQQFSSNASAAQGSLQTENNALDQVQTQLQSLYSLALQAGSGTQSQTSLDAIAAQAVQIQNTLLGVANTQDGEGQYIFGGYATQTQPFALSPTGATYSGDQGQRQVQIAAGQTLGTADNGDLVFNQIKNGNGTFTVTAGPNATSGPNGTPGPNTGTGIIGATTVTSASTYAGGSYTIKFTAPGTYQVLDSTQAVVSSGAYTSGAAIAFAGVQVTLTGQPATGDTFAVAPSKNQSIFTTVQNLVTALQTYSSGPSQQTNLNNALATALGNINQAIDQTSAVVSQVGGRLNQITTQQSVGTNQQLQLKQSISTLQSLDYPSALTTLQSENTQLQAAMQAFTLTQGLSLFKYIPA
jgi:flagellar hook-associated protein 3 FlgL